MREYGQIQCAFWTHPKIRKLTKDARQLAMYLLTGPHSNGIGCYWLPEGYAIADTQFDTETLSKGFEDLSDIGFVHRCEQTEFVMIPGFLQWNPISNGNVAKARAAEFARVPKQLPFYRLLATVLLEDGKHWSKDFERVLTTASNSIPDQNPTQPNPNLYASQGGEGTTPMVGVVTTRAGHRADG